MEQAIFRFIVLKPAITDPALFFLRAIRMPVYPEALFKKINNAGERWPLPLNTGLPGNSCVYPYELTDPACECSISIELKAGRERNGGKLSGGKTLLWLTPFNDPTHKNTVKMLFPENLKRTYCFKEDLFTEYVSICLAQASPLPAQPPHFHKAGIIYDSRLHPGAPTTGMHPYPLSLFTEERKSSPTVIPFLGSSPPPTLVWNLCVCFPATVWGCHHGLISHLQ